MTVESATTKCARCGHSKAAHVMFGAGCTASDRYQGCRCVASPPSHH